VDEVDEAQLRLKLCIGIDKQHRLFVDEVDEAQLRLKQRIIGAMRSNSWKDNKLGGIKERMTNGTE